MAYIELFIKIKSEKNIKKLYDKIQKINGEYGDIDFFAVVTPKRNLDTKYEWAGGSFGETLKANKLYAWIGGSKDFIRYHFRGIEVSPGIDKYVRLDSKGHLENGFWENDFLKHCSVDKGILQSTAKKELK